MDLGSFRHHTSPQGRYVVSGSRGGPRDGNKSRQPRVQHTVGTIGGVKWLQLENDEGFVSMPLFPYLYERLEKEMLNPACAPRTAQRPMRLAFGTERPGKLTNFLLAAKIWFRETELPATSTTKLPPLDFTVSDIVPTEPGWCEVLFSEFYDFTLTDACPFWGRRCCAPLGAQFLPPGAPKTLAEICRGNKDLRMSSKKAQIVCEKPEMEVAKILEPATLPPPDLRILSDDEVMRYEIFVEEQQLPTSEETFRNWVLAGGCF